MKGHEKKLRKTPGDIIILHLFIKNLDMIYSSRDIECDRLTLVIMGHFLFFYPPSLMVPEIHSEISFCHFGPFFAHLPP